MADLVSRAQDCSEIFQRIIACMQGDVSELLTWTRSTENSWSTEKTRLALWIDDLQMLELEVIREDKSFEKTVKAADLRTIFEDLETELAEVLSIATGIRLPFEGQDCHDSMLSDHDQLGDLDDFPDLCEVDERFEAITEVIDSLFRATNSQFQWLAFTRVEAGPQHETLRNVQSRAHRMAPEGSPEKESSVVSRGRDETEYGDVAKATAARPSSSGIPEALHDNLHHLSDNRGQEARYDLEFESRRLASRSLPVSARDQQLETPSNKPIDPRLGTSSHEGIAPSPFQASPNNIARLPYERHSRTARPYKPNGRREYRDKNRGNLKFYFHTRDNVYVYEDGSTASNLQYQQNISSSSAGPSGLTSSANIDPARTVTYGYQQGISSSSAPVAIPSRNVIGSSGYDGLSSLGHPQSPAYSDRVPIPASLSKHYDLEHVTSRLQSTEGCTKQSRPHEFFVLGKVFARDTPERSDDTGGDGATQYSSRIKAYREGETTYKHRQRFIVVAQFQESCRAVPLTTYDGQGVARRGVVKCHHAVVHTSERSPGWRRDEWPSTGERPMFTKSIRVVSEDRTEKLQEMCRVNYGATEHIMHDMPVKSFGNVDTMCLRDLVAQYRSVMLGTYLEASDSGTIRPMYAALPPSSPYQSYLSAQAGSSRPAPASIPPSATTNTLIRRGAPEDVTDPTLIKRGYFASVALSDYNDQTFPQYHRMQYPMDYFTVGRVFSVLFDETTSGIGDISQYETSQQKDVHGRPITTRTRKFVVVRVKKEHTFCSALPIMTYGGYGVSGQSVRKSEHGIIHTSETPIMANGEKPRRDESPMRRTPLLVVPDRKYDQLDPAARVNYGEIVTVHFATRVKTFGMVHRKCRGPLKLQWESVWEDKIKRGDVPPPRQAAEQGPVDDSSEDSDDDEEDDDEDDEDDSYIGSDQRRS